MLDTNEVKRHPLVSLIVTTRNEEKNIESCLLSIKHQTYPRERLETIVVDNASTDRTKDLARWFTDRVFDKGPERSAQRNYGMMEVASGEYVMFVDADMILAPGLIQGCVDFMTGQKYLALHIPEIVLGRNYWSRVRRFERSFYDGTVIDGARFFLKDAFIRVGGFDESLSGPEDWDIDKKMKRLGLIGLLDKGGGSISNWELSGLVKERGVAPEEYGCVIYHNEAEFELGKYLKKKLYYAGSFDAYVAKWPADDADVKKQLGLWYRFIGVFVENGKWKRLVSQPVLAFGMYFLRLLVGLAFLGRRKKA